jgi:hypothetical protein
MRGRVLRSSGMLVPGSILGVMTSGPDALDG